MPTYVNSLKKSPKHYSVKVDPRFIIMSHHSSKILSLHSIAHLPVRSSTYSRYKSLTLGQHKSNAPPETSDIVRVSQIKQSSVTPASQVKSSSAIVTTFTYDSSDRNVGITEANANGSTTTYARDVQGRLLYRHQDTNGSNVSNDYYGYTASGDSPDFITDVTGSVTEKYLTLPGDVMVTIRPNRTSAGVQTYSLANKHAYLASYG